MGATRLRPWTPADLPRAVEFWNRAFADRRNFFAIDERDLAERVTENPAGFDPEGLVVALEGESVVGMGHAVRLEEGEGRIAFLAVDPARRRRGIGSRLLDACRRYLAGCREVALDGQCFTPYYGNVQGPFLPFWGTPEGIGLPSSDEASIAFFARRGFAVRFEAVSLDRPVPAAASRGASYHLLEGATPPLGGPLEARLAYVRAGEFLTWAAVLAGRVAGTLVALSLERAVPGTWGIYQLEVDASARGRGLGTGLLARTLATLADRGVERCEVLTIPALSPGADRLYEKNGFEVVERWAIY